MIKARDKSIDLLKFFAALLITNSHIEVFEPQYGLSTGGAIGDALFFFCSGYTLFMGNMGRFDNWYKRRLTRIFPPIIVWGILLSFCFNIHRSMFYTIVHSGGWFIKCILIYYLIAYPIRKYALSYLRCIFICSVVLLIVWYITIEEDTFFIYGWNYFKWGVYFLIFLEGAMLGTQYIKRQRSLGISILGLIVCIFLFYVICVFQFRCMLLHKFQILSVFALLGITFYFYQCCHSRIMEHVFDVKIARMIVRGIGGLCFEIYLVQQILMRFTLSLNYPYNVIEICLLILFWAYVLRVTTNFFLQTVRQNDYNWKSMLSIY